MADKQKSWQHRLENTPDELAMNFVESLSYDRRLYKYDIQGSIAHCEMLEKQGLMSRSEREAVVKGLLEIQAEIEAGSFVFDVSQEDIHMAVEAALIEKTGDAGRKLHTGRSRNDQIATDMRLWMRDQISALLDKLAGLQTAFVELAEKYTEDVMPSYTHLQRAQPIVIAAYLLSFTEQFERDKGRLKDLAVRVNISPLGSGAAAGSTLPIDREITAEKLGFAGITQNSIDAVSDRDFCAEFAFACSMIMTHLSKLAEDFIIFSSTEFSFVKISDKYCTSSSMMPQKRNPDMLELIRGKAGNVFGSLSSLMMMLKAQPSTYNRDLQEEKIHIFNAADYAENCLEMAAAIVSNTQFRTDKIASGIDEGFLDATSLAEYLVKKGVPFRQAHGTVGTAVALCEKRGLKLAELELDEFKKLSDAVEEDVYESLTAANVAKAYTSPGAAGKAQSEERIRYWKEKLQG
ncbi:Argininosuccinate lyase 1 [Sedimentisphaera cyanobacteriorum]|uniref:Argininosuccinate lyase n=1 Tax=Sedimentisphaera cyanobacteriorum TaxID=1940790 RepID=A0A1Q2HRR8_9BACT|nr:argininosuccinate lyase [Sedimentisphaera cyanobacteriorum]AQQ09923.1 Argininosuccinate lyase 1 [Sedimentisphaera cyanobacteriorum]